jgi:hypothetical protein
MSEKIYSFLLRLYPARFRRQYGAEALQLFRDRQRDEQGLQRKLHLWIDLLIDFSSGIPSAYRNTYTTAATTTAWQTVTGFPAFRTLEEEPLRPASIATGGIFAMAMIALFIFAMNHSAAYHPFSGSIARLGAAPAGSVSNPDVQAVAEKVEEQIRSANQLQSCFFEKLERHPGNIGYVKLGWFADPAKCGAVADAVMQRLNETDVVIFDLRDTRGGYPEMVRSYERRVARKNRNSAEPNRSI